MEYSIGKFVQLTNLGIHTLRYYEQEGLIAPGRNSRNRRCYSEQDLAWVEFIKRLKDTGMPIREIRRYAALRAARESTLPERLDMLLAHKEALGEQIRRLKEHLAKLEDKIDFYRQEIERRSKIVMRKRIKIVEVMDRTTDLVTRLLSVWEISVRATHLFLSDREIKRIKEYVLQALQGVAHLVIAEADGGRPVAFMGIEEDRLEMLFISPAERGKGLGKRLLRYGMENYDVKRLTVNEQNPQAREFYEGMGFRVYKRTDHDEQGNPYPLLYMSLSGRG